MDLARIVELNAAYARVIDNEQFEEWPKLFHDPCLYKVTTAENVARGLEGGLIFADTRGMLEDRISSLRNVNIYEPQRYRHMVSAVLVERESDRLIKSTANFLVVRIMDNGENLLFASGRYVDQITVPELKYAERVVICDSRRFDTLLAIPL